MSENLNKIRSVTVSDDLWEFARTFSKQKDLTISQLLRRILLDLQRDQQQTTKRKKNVS